MPDAQDLNRDDQQMPGRPPRPASESAGSKGSSRNAKTLTDPATGAPAQRAPAPNRAHADDSKG